MNEPALIWLCYSGFVFSWICGLCFFDLCYSTFSDLCFPSSFPNSRKYFLENFLKCNQTPWKHFPFPKISISGKYVFSGKRFTATKHSLSSIACFLLWGELWFKSSLTYYRNYLFIHFYKKGDNLIFYHDFHIPNASYFKKKKK